MQGLDEQGWVVDGRQVRGLVAGTTGPAVVMLPGLGTPEYLCRWARRCARWARVVLLDLPGWRLRDRSCAPTVQGVAEAARRWLELVDAHDVVLVGHSTGATSALLLASRDPGRLHALFLAGTVFDPAARRLPTLALRTLRSLTPRLLPEVPAMAPPLVRAGPRDLVRLVRSALDVRPEQLLPGLGVPTTLATGARDHFGRCRWVRGVAAQAGLPAVVLPGRHNDVFTAPAAVDDALRSALAG